MFKILLSKFSDGWKWEEGRGEVAKIKNRGSEDSSVFLFVLLW
jgi:hypothetical protein